MTNRIAALLLAVLSLTNVFLATIAPSLALGMINLVLAAYMGFRAWQYYRA